MMGNTKQKILACGAIAGAIVAVFSLAGLSSDAIQSHRFWAERKVETIVAGLQIESLQSRQDKIRYRRYELEQEQQQQKQSFPKWKRDFLEDLKRQQKDVERELERLERKK